MAIDGLVPFNVEPRDYYRELHPFYQTVTHAVVSDPERALNALADAEDSVAVDLARELEVEARQYLHCYIARRLGAVPPPFQLLVADVLQTAYEGVYDHVVLIMPYGHGKSTTLQLFTSWYMGHRPRDRVIYATNVKPLAERAGREIKRHVIDDGWPFPGIGVDPSKSSASDWATSLGGEFFGVGTEGTVTGRRGDLIVTDDLVHGRKDAESPKICQAAIDWLRDDLSTRGTGPTTLRIDAGTRWSYRDPMSTILPRDFMGDSGVVINDHGEEIMVVHLMGVWDPVRLLVDPDDGSERWAEVDDAIGREPGEPLWPEAGRDAAWYAAEKARLGSYSYAALVDGMPSPREGNLFKREWFKYLDALSEQELKAKTIRRWDLAGTEEADNPDAAYTAGVKMSLHAREADGSRYVVVQHVVREKRGPREVRQLVRSTAEEDGRRVRVRLSEDPGQAGKGQVQDYVNLLAGFSVKGVKETGDKLLRAEPLAAAAENGDVYLLRGTWNAAFVDELCSAPGRYMDQVDAASGAYSELLDKRPSKNDGKHLVAVSSSVVAAHADRL